MCTVVPNIDECNAEIQNKTYGDFCAKRTRLSYLNLGYTLSDSQRNLVFYVDSNLDINPDSPDSILDSRRQYNQFLPG